MGTHAINEKNRKAFALIQKGFYQKAIDTLRPIVLPKDMPKLDPAAPPVCQANFILALLLEGREEVFCEYITQLPRDHHACLALHEVHDQWLAQCKKQGLFSRMFGKKLLLTAPPDLPKGWLEEEAEPEVAAGHFNEPQHTAIAAGQRVAQAVHHFPDPFDTGMPRFTPLRSDARPADPARPLRDYDPDKPRVIRIFISSTFRDMVRERNLLVKEVFPVIRRKCAERFATFTEVDLRWGIGKDQADEGKTLPLLLAEIERSRPFFLCLLGERYGWVPDEIPQAVIAREPWLAYYQGKRTSITELEILHGVLKDLDTRRRAFFYFRDPAYAQSKYLSAEERLEMTERDLKDDIREFGPEEAARRTAERLTKLADLKERIKKSGYPLVQNYAGPEALKELVIKQFTELLDDLYPEEEKPSAIELERMAHESHAQGKRFACIGRPQHLAALDRFAQAEPGTQGLVLHGESGSGKSSLLAQWAADWRTRYPDDFLFQHYFGATPESTWPDGFLTRLLGELKQRFGLDYAMPYDSIGLRTALPFWFASIKTPNRIVLVLDGLDQVRDEDAERLDFLPVSFSYHVLVLASTTPGQALDTLTARGWQEHFLPLAEAHEVRGMIDAYCEKFGRFVDEQGQPLPSELQTILPKSESTRNPLYLRTLLEELRQVGQFEHLASQAGHYLKAPTPTKLFQTVIKRWQQDFDGPGERADLVRRALTLLWTANKGLSGTELLDLLGSNGQPLPHATWSGLFMAMEPHLSQQAGLYSFAHKFLQEAVADLFLSDQADEKAAHLTLADYFEQQEPSSRQVDELPWHLRFCGEDDRLRKLLLHLPFCLVVLEEDNNELLRHWLWLGETHLKTMGDAYLEALHQWGEHHGSRQELLKMVNIVGQFLYSAARYNQAEPLFRWLVKQMEQSYGKEHPDVAVGLNNLARLLQATNRLSEAEPLLRRALAINEQSYGKEHPSVAIMLSSLALLLRDTNRLSEAEPLMRRALAIDEQSYGKEHPDVAIGLNNLAQLLQATNRLSEAEPLMRRALAIDEQSYGKEHPSVARDLINLAMLLRDTNRLSEAEPLMRRALGINEQSYGKEHPDVAIGLNSLALLLQDTNRLSEAEPLMRRALAIDEQSYGKEHPSVATKLNNLALLLLATNRLSEAEPLMRRALAINEQSYGKEHPDVAAGLNNLAQLLKGTNRLSEAEPLMRRALAIDEQSYGKEHPMVATRLNNLAGLLHDTNRLPEAEPLMRRALAIDEQSYGKEHPSVATKLNNLALLLLATNRLSEAEPLMRRALAINEQSYGKEHPDVAAGLNNLAQLLKGTNRLSEAEPLMRRALAIDEQSYGKEHPMVATRLNNLALLLQGTNRLSEAEPLMRRALLILFQCTREIGSIHPHLQGVISIYAGLLEKNGSTEEEIKAALRELAPDFFSREIGSIHPHLQGVISIYAGLLEENGSTEEEIKAALRKMAPGFF